jgi:hypothetical protein
MRRELDPLYSLFEQHLLTALVEDETSDEFVNRVVIAYLGRLVTDGAVIPKSHQMTLESDLKEEVMEMFRKKTYGHFNLSSYRKANGVETTPTQPLDTIDNSAWPKEKARRSGRA